MRHVAAEAVMAWRIGWKRVQIKLSVPHGGGLTCDVAAEGMMAWRIGCSREDLAPRFAGSAGTRIFRNRPITGNFFNLLIASELGNSPPFY
jgi:hypothetical protein